MISPRQAKETTAPSTSSPANLFAESATELGTLATLQIRLPWALPKKRSYVAALISLDQILWPINPQDDVYCDHKRSYWPQRMHSKGRIKVPAQNQQHRTG